MKPDDPSQTHLKRAKQRAAELLIEQSAFIRAAAEQAALEPYDTDSLANNALARTWVTELAQRVAIATLSAVVATQPVQYRGANGDYVTLERLAKLRDGIVPRRENYDE